MLGDWWDAHLFEFWMAAIIVVLFLVVGAVAGFAKALKGSGRNRWEEQVREWEEETLFGEWDEED